MKKDMEYSKPRLCKFDSTVQTFCSVGSNAANPLQWECNNGDGIVVGGDCVLPGAMAQGDKFFGKSCLNGVYAGTRVLGQSCVIGNNPNLIRADTGLCLVGGIAN